MRFACLSGRVAMAAWSNKRRNARLKFIKSQSGITIYFSCYVVCSFVLLSVIVPQLGNVFLIIYQAVGQKKTRRYLLRYRHVKIKTRKFELQHDGFFLLPSCGNLYYLYYLNNGKTMEPEASAYIDTALTRIRIAPTSL